MSWHGHVHQESLVMMLIDLLIWLHQQLEPSIFMLLTKMMERMSKLLGICFKNSDLPSFTTLLWVSRFLLIHDLSHASLRKQLTFGATTTGFPIKWRLRNKRRNSILMMCHYLDLDSASDWSCHIGNLIQPIRSTTQIWVVMCHQYGISALISQTSFGEETSGGVTKCRLFSQANLMLLWVENWFLKLLLKSQTPKHFWSIFRVHFQGR